MTRLWVSAALAAAAATGILAAQERPRARDLGLTAGAGTPGPLNAITDVAGVRIGHTTLAEGDRVRTGVTAIVPHSENLFEEKVPGRSSSATRSASLPGRPRSKSSARSKRRSS